jgi:23S rRNA pseudouridine955/2504/2580 synthase
MAKEFFFTWKVSKVFSKKNLLFFLEKNLKSYPSKRAIKKAIEKNACKVNGKVERFSSRKLEKNDLVQFDSHWQELIAIKQLFILYEDSHLVVFDKPSGIESRLENFSQSLFLCHRLDKETSGVIILAKDTETQNKIKKSFKKREIQKTYLAIVEKKIHKSAGQIKSYLNKKKRQQGQTLYGSSFVGKEAVTDWRCIGKNDLCSFLMIFPVTGRTHQIRVHFKEMGHPILGDFLYNPKSAFPYTIPRLLLHSYKIAFIHPVISIPISLQAKIPEEFYSCLRKGKLCLDESLL